MNKMKNMPVCDLRSMTDPATIRNIEEISNVALVVLPDDATGEVLQAFHSISMRNVASTITLSKEDVLRVANGVSEITDSDFSPDQNVTLIVNGIAVIPSLSPGIQGTLYVNGLVIVNEHLRRHQQLHLAMTNGLRLYAAFDQYKLFPKSVDVDRDFLTWLPIGTVIIAGNQIRISDNVTIEQMQEKQVSFVAGNTIQCPKTILGYVKTVSTAGNTIEADKPDDIRD